MSWLLHKVSSFWDVSQVQLGSCCGTMALSLPLHPWGAFSSHCRWPIPWCFTPSDAGGYTPRWGRSGSAYFRKSGKHLATRRNSLKGYDHPKITSWVVYNEFFEEVTIYNPEVVESVTEIKLLKLLRRALSLEVTLNPVRKVNTIATNMSNKMNM